MMVVYAVGIVMVLLKLLYVCGQCGGTTAEFFCSKCFDVGLDLKPCYNSCCVGSVLVVPIHVVLIVPLYKCVGK